MAGSGGRVTHTLARAGWLVCATLGAIAMMVVAVFYAADPVARGTDPAAATLVGAMIVFVPIGAALGALVGLPVQFVTRAVLRSRVPVPPAAKPTNGLTQRGRWARSYKACARSVTAFHAIVATVSSAAAREWLAGIGETLDDELAEALRLAQIGQSLAPTGEPKGTALTVQDMLGAAEKSFAETTERAASIALDLRDDSDFARVRAQLDMLAEQAPQLRAADLD
ncbi:MAG TPA: hypothetical protein VGP26_21485 [Actinophytocola sp.]|jgi:hypothetical protein|nr:hypothetical protein [Actinophytocola sp.]